LFAEAISRWEAVGAEAAALTNVGMQMSSLPGQIVGPVLGNTIFVNPTAAGYGWLTDPGQQRPS